jgi:hypothetical protein
MVKPRGREDFWLEREARGGRRKASWGESGGGRGLFKWAGEAREVPLDQPEPPARVIAGKPPLFFFLSLAVALLAVRARPKGAGMRPLGFRFGCAVSSTVAASVRR